jgi:site-specific recombinase XerD
MKKISHFKTNDSGQFVNSNYIITQYDQYLDKVQGLASRTRKNYCRAILTFLTSQFPSGKARVQSIHPQKVIHFILAYAQEGGVKRAQAMVYSLRSFFRFLKNTGRIKHCLADSVPKVPVWKKRSIPVFLSSKELQQLLDSCDRDLVIGLRDYAILMMLIFLGVRACEICEITLADVDWQKGEIIIRGKGSKSRLPLSQDVGDALASYLQFGRPKCAENRFFISVKNPLRGLSSSAIRHIVHTALVRSGLNPEKKGTHLLRHSFATQLLQEGATLQEIGMILRHRRIDTTAIYATVDFDRLKLLAMPWPSQSNHGGAK